MEAHAEPLPEIVVESAIDSHKLTRQLGLRDLVLTQILCVVGSSWVGVAAGLGRAQAIVWIAAMLFFYAPLAMFAIPIAGAAALRNRLPHWVAWTSGVGFAFTIFAFLLTAYPFVEVVNARAYAAKILGTTALANIVGYSFYRVRKGRTKVDVQA